LIHGDERLGLSDLERKLAPGLLLAKLTRSGFAEHWNTAVCKPAFNCAPCSTLINRLGCLGVTREVQGIGINNIPTPWLANPCPPPFPAEQSDCRIRQDNLSYLLISISGAYIYIYIQADLYIAVIKFPAI
jgi:hypothetical protein